MLYLFIFILLLILFYCFFCRKEPFQERQTIILLGDSILQNELYSTPSVESLLSKDKSVNSYCYAEDNAFIQDVYSQMDKIPSELNNKNTWIFVSIGGNDLLEKYKNKYSIQDYDLPMKNIQKEYKKCIFDLYKKYNNSHIVLLNIFYPVSEDYSFFYPHIDQWNSFLETLYFPILSLDFLKEKDDFVDSIEPSVKGGKRIVDHILNFINK